MIGLPLFPLSLLLWNAHNLDGTFERVMEPIGKTVDVLALHHFSKYNRIRHINFSGSNFVGDEFIQMWMVIFEWVKLFLHLSINGTPIVSVQSIFHGASAPPCFVSVPGRLAEYM